MPETLALIALVFPAAMALAAVFDFFTMTIPNRLTLGLALAFFPAALIAGFGALDMAWHVAAGATMLVVSFALFSQGWIGGGDAKLFAAVALWLGWQPLLAYVILFSLLGGALTLVLLFARQFPLPAALCRADWALRLHDRRSGIPYGIALAAAALAVYPRTPWPALFGA